MGVAKLLQRDSQGSSKPVRAALAPRIAVAVEPRAHGTTLEKSFPMRSNKLRPRTLAESLDLWALRREKVLELLDIKAAKQARDLASMCRQLARVPMHDPDWDFRWMTIRAATAALLERHRSVPPPPNGLAPQAFYGPRTIPPASQPPPPRESVTNTIRVEEMPISERPTRVAEAVWFWDEDEIKVA